MTMRGATVEFSLQPYEPSVNPSSISGEDLTNSLLSAGIEIIRIKWADAGEIVLAVEDDAQFLVEAYQEFLALDGSGTCVAYLGDGSFEVISTLKGDIVEAEYIMTPHLDNRLTRRTTIASSKECYVGAWARLVEELLKLSHGDESYLDGVSCS